METHVSMITPLLWVGTEHASYDSFPLVVNLAFRYEGDGFKKHAIVRHERNGQTVIKVGILDLPSEPLDRFLPELVDLILERWNAGEKVLVHCAFGISRSASVAIAAIASHAHMTFDEAFAFVKEKRPIVTPTNAFREHVRAFLGKI